MIAADVGGLARLDLERHIDRLAVRDRDRAGRTEPGHAPAGDLIVACRNRDRDLFARLTAALEVRIPIERHHMRHQARIGALRHAAALNLHVSYGGQLRGFAFMVHSLRVKGGDDVAFARLETAGLEGGRIKGVETG